MQEEGNGRRAASSHPPVGFERNPARRNAYSPPPPEKLSPPDHERGGHEQVPESTSQGPAPSIPIPRRLPPFSFPAFVPRPPSLTPRGASPIYR